MNNTLMFNALLMRQKLKNFALASEGGIIYSDLPAEYGNINNLIQGYRGYANADYETKTAIYSAPTYPSIIEVGLNVPRKISQINIFANQAAAGGSPLNPTLSDAAEYYYLTNIKIQSYLSGAYTTLVPTTGTSGKIWNQFNFAPITATNIMLTDISGNFGINLIGIEVWGTN